MYIGKLTKIDSTNNNLRTQEVEGVFFNLPTKGKSFHMHSEALDPDLDPNQYVRQITTSTVVSSEIINEKEIIFKTQNSTYRIEINGMI